MKIINLDKGNSGTYIGFVNSSLTVDEDYEAVVNRLVYARDVRTKNKADGPLFLEFHSGGEPVLVAVDKIEVIGSMGED